MDVLLVADAGRARERYLRLLEEFGARPLVAVEPAAVMGHLRDGDFGGIVFDEPTLIKDGRYNVMLLRGLCERYPVLHVMCDPERDTLHVLGSRHYASCREGVLEFLGECREFLSIRRRGRLRRDAFLPVLLWPDDGAAGAAERAITRNISRFGCFVATASAWEREARIRLVFEDVDLQPVLGRVVWRQEPHGWRPSGIGVRFLAPHEALLAAVAHLEAAREDAELSFLCESAG